MELRNKKLNKIERYNKDFLVIYENSKVISILLISEKQLKELFNETKKFGVKYE